MNKFWTKDDIEQLAKLKGDGLALREIAEIMNRSYEAIKHKSRALNVLLHDLVPNQEENDVTNLVNKNENLIKENEELRAQLYQLHKSQTTVFHNSSTEHIKFGLLGDTQLGSYYECLDALNLVYDIYQEHGIDCVYHTGDLIDGQNMYKGHIYEVHTVGCDRQMEYCAKNYPSRNGMVTRFITGNHDLCYYKREGIDIGKHISAMRPDMEYLGPEQVDVNLSKKNNIFIRIQHPGGGTAYAISYKTQKMINSMSGGDKPHLLALGHYHKADFLPCDRNIASIQTGTLQRQTPFMKNLGTAAHIGAWIVEADVSENSLNNIHVKWIAFYEKRGKVELLNYESRVK